MPEDEQSVPERGPFGLSPAVGLRDLLVAAVVAVVPVVALPMVGEPTIVPKIALLAVAGLVGLVLLVDQAGRGDRAAQAGAAFAAWAVLAAVLAPSPRLALLGGYAIDRGAVVLACFVGCWALGRATSPEARGLVLAAAGFALVLNVVTGAAQVVVDLGGSWLAVGDGRASGLTPSSVYLGGVAAAGLAAAAAVVAREQSRRTAVLALTAVVVATLGANLSGSRIGLVGGVAVAAAALLVRRASWRRMLAVGGAVALGLVLAGLIASDGVSSTGRAAEEPTSGVGTRTEMWGHGVAAWAERPVVGWGPGRFREATSPRVSEHFARAEGVDKLFFDAHSLPVEVLTTTGGVGLVLAGGFAVLAVRRARGPLVWLAAGLAVTWLLEPMSVATAPVALIALGAAGPRPSSPAPAASPRGVRAGAAFAGAVGAVLAVAVVWAGAQMKVAADTADLDAAERALAVHRRDPAVGDLRSKILYIRQGEEPSPANLDALLASTREVVSWDPSNHTWWVRQGTVELMDDDPEAAVRSFEASLARSPWSLSAWYGLEQAAGAAGDTELEARAHDRVCGLAPSVCED